MENEEINLEQFIKLQKGTNYKLQKDNKVFVRSKDLGSVDYLVLTIILLLSVGISLSRSLLGKRPQDCDNEQLVKYRYKIQDKKDKEWTLRRVVGFSIATAGSMVSPFVNTLCLFSLNGEVFENDISIVFIFLGILLTFPIIYAMNFYSIMRTNRFKSVAFYLKKRFNAKICSLLVVTSSVIKQVIGGSLNLHIVGVVVSAMTELSSVLVAVLVAFSCIICVSTSRIHVRSSTSFGGIFIWLLGATLLITLLVVTTNAGGWIELWNKASIEGKIAWPTLTLRPWEGKSLWGNLSIGFFIGFQIYFFSRVTLRCVVELPPRVLYSTITVSLIYILLWLCVGVWAGICTSVVFESSSYKETYLSPRRIDGSLAKMVSLEMDNHGGFRGFFVAALLAASISGLSRRYNQLIGLIHLLFKDLQSSLGFEEEDEKNSPSYILKNPPPGASETFLNQMRWEERQRTCCPIFMFKFICGLTFGILTLWLVWILFTSSERIFELWVTVIGIVNGPVFAVILIAIMCPFIPHFSVVIGLIMGWIVPTALAIASRFLINPRTPEGDLQPIRTPSFLDSLWESDFHNIKNSNFDDEVLGTRTQLPVKFHILSTQYRVISTCFCYYGIIGFLTCFVVSLIFTGILSKCRPSNDVPVNLVHPKCARLLRSTVEYVQSRKVGDKLNTKNRQTALS